MVDWLPHSPDLNPLDFSIWRVLQGKGHTNLDVLYIGSPLQNGTSCSRIHLQDAAHFNQPGGRCGEKWHLH
jgi:hypothetical protein